MNIKKQVLHHSYEIFHFLRKNKKYTITVGILIIGFFVYLFSGSSTDEIQVQKKHIITSGAIENSIKVLGDTKITNQQTLTFAYEGTIKGVYVKEGDIVKKVQLLAEIDKTDLQKNIAQQSLSLENSKINYQKSLK